MSQPLVHDITEIMRGAIQICSPVFIEQPKRPSSPSARLTCHAYPAAQTDALGLTPAALVPYEREVPPMIMAPQDQPDMTVLRPKPTETGKTL